MLKIAIGSDHAGFQLKEAIKKYLKELGYDYEDFGTDSEEPVNYPDFAAEVARVVNKNVCSKGILICGSGIGMSIVANKFPGVRAALYYDVTSAKLSREHNDANILTIGARMVDKKKAKEIVKAWLTTEFAGGRHKKRIDKIKEIEKEL